MVAERHGVGAGLDQLVENCLGDAEAAGGVLAVDDDKVERVAAAQAGQRVDYRLAAGAADDVAEKEETHSGSETAQRA